MIGVERRALLVLASTLPLVGGCGLLPESPICLDELYPAVTLVVSDSASGAALKSPVAIVRDGAYVDTAGVYSGDSTIYGAALGRAGTYAVTVDHLGGYRRWERSGVRVRRGDCGPESVRLEVRLQSIAL